MIWGIIAAISIAVLGFLILPSLWFWICWEIFAAVLVAIGCIAEWYLLKTPAKPGHEDEHRRKELRFILAVAIGVTMELIGLAHAIPAAVRLEGDVAEAKERAAKFEIQAAELKKANLELEALIAPRTLSTNQQQRIAALIGRFSGLKVDVVSYSQDPEGARLVWQLGAVLSTAQIQPTLWAGQVMQSGAFDIGISVRGPTNETEFVEAFVDALKSIGNLEATANSPMPRVSMAGGGYRQPYPRTSIMVGMKPLPK